MGQQKKLTARQTAFIEHYLQTWNASEAARRAGYTGDANTVGPRLLADVGISEAIATRLQDLKATTNEVLVRLTQHARGSLDDFVSASGEIDLAAAKRAGLLHLAKRIKIQRGKVESVEVELYDAQGALSKLGEAHGIFKKRIEFSWQEQAAKDGYDPEQLKEQLVSQFLAAMVGAGRGRSLPSGQANSGDAQQPADMGADQRPTEDGIGY